MCSWSQISVNSMLWTAPLRKPHQLDNRRYATSRRFRATSTNRSMMVSSSRRLFRWRTPSTWLEAYSTGFSRANTQRVWEIVPPQLTSKCQHLSGMPMKMTTNPAVIRCLQCMSVCNCIGCEPNPCLACETNTSQRSMPWQLHAYILLALPNCFHKHGCLCKGRACHMVHVS